MSTPVVSTTGTLRPDFQHEIAFWEGHDLQGIGLPIHPSPPAARLYRDPAMVFTPGGHAPYAVMLARCRGMAVQGGLRRRKDESLAGPAGRVLTGLAGGAASALYLLLNSGPEVEIYWGVRAEAASEYDAISRAAIAFRSLQTCLLSAYAELDLRPLRSEEDFAPVLKRLAAMRVALSMVGHPWPEAPDVERFCPVDQLVRALSGTDYCYCLDASPVSTADVDSAFQDLSLRINLIHQHVSWSESGQQTSIQSEQRQRLDRLAQYQEQLMESAHEKMAAGLREGMWKASTLLAASEAGQLDQAASLLRAVFAGARSKPQPVTILRHEPPDAAIADLRQLRAGRTTAGRPNPLGLGALCDQTVLTSSEAGLLAELPRREVCGFCIKTPREFSVDLESADRKAIDLGEIIGHAGSTGRRFSIDLDDLTRHALIVGVTGGGKTNTALHLVHQLWTRHRVPFMVIEPAKAQYRNLLGVPGFEDLQVFTPGLAQVAPFPLNPFEFAPGTIPQQHISLLYAVFNAAFILYPPMPYVLERSLHRIYEERGWDMLVVHHPEADPASDEPPPLAFPTLSDLHRTIGEVVDQLGYESRIRMDVTAGLQARVDTLRIGQKGQTFDCPRSVPFEDLLSRPTVLEIAHLGSDEEKAFFMGLLLMRLYETLERRGEQPGLEHVTLIEEAHRLLSRTSTDTSSAESANPKGKAVETFCNMLAEIRAYGEGLLVAEQIPAKLADDMIKNTNLKVMHRIVATDDRDLMGGAMNLIGRQKMAVTSLRRGEAVAYAEGCEMPALVRIPRYVHARPAGNHDVKTAAERVMIQHEKVFRPWHGCRRCREICAFGAEARRLVAGRGVFETLWAYALSCAYDPEAAITAWPRLIEQLAPHRQRSRRSQTEDEALAWCVFITACESTLWALHGSNRATLRTIQHVVQSLIDLVHQSRQTGTASPSQAHQLRQHIDEAMNADGRPWAGCTACRHVCLFSPLGERLADTPGLRKTLSDLYAAKAPTQAIRDFCRQRAAAVLFTPCPDIVDSLGLCALVHWTEQTHLAPTTAIADVFPTAT
ncbi:MAG TPA: ATP-binding protein [Phycisphaerae bacterium]|nr:ATP-binding protein [Phycisphaerae bacterium]HRY67355.1 ATP-binding protein [Phycisphaerae bacterium]